MWDGRQSKYRFTEEEIVKICEARSRNRDKSAMDKYIKRLSAVFTGDEVILTETEIRNWCMEISDGSIGPHWTVEQTEIVKKQRGIQRPWPNVASVALVYPIVV